MTTSLLCAPEQRRSPPAHEPTGDCASAHRCEAEWSAPPAAGDGLRRSGRERLATLGWQVGAGDRGGTAALEGAGRPATGRAARWLLDRTAATRGRLVAGGRPSRPVGRPAGSPGRPPTSGSPGSAVVLARSRGRCARTSGLLTRRWRWVGGPRRGGGRLSGGGWWRRRVGSRELAYGRGISADLEQAERGRDAQDADDDRERGDDADLRRPADALAVQRLQDQLHPDEARGSPPARCPGRRAGSAARRAGSRAAAAPSARTRSR